VVDGALQRIHTCHAYLASLALLNAIGQLAEQHDHHPDLMLNYKRLTVRYWTFRAKGITALDVEMALRIEAVDRESWLRAANIPKGRRKPSRLFDEYKMGGC
jgi:4a-hydroxytetrahydrobiopterin dehydratase